MIVLLTIVLITSTCVLTYYFCNKKKNFFELWNIPHDPPIQILGNMAPYVFQKKSFLQVVEKMYNSYSEAKYIGMYNFQTPVIIIRDPEIIKSIIEQNFEVLPDHSNLTEVKCDPLFLPESLFHLNDDWSELRNKLNPSFTSSNIKLIFNLIMESAVNFTDTLYERSKVTDCVLNLKDVFTKFSTDVIVSSVFGIEVDSIKNPTNEFYLLCREKADSEIILKLKSIFMKNLKLVARFWGIKIFDESVQDFVKDVLRLNIARRRKKGIFRQDLLQMMMEAKYKNDEIRMFSDEDIISNAFSFYSIGMDHIATQLCFITYEIALNPEVQKKLQEEIDAVLKKGKEQSTYDVIKNLQFLDAVIQESMRLYPSSCILDRVCKRKFLLPPPLPGKQSITLEPGMTILIPVLALNRDPKYYKNPEKFDPGRFVGDNKFKINEATFLPFGIEPRICIAYKFAELAMKILLFLILGKCNLKLCSKTPLDIKFRKDSIILHPEEDLWLNLEARE